MRLQSRHNLTGYAHEYFGGLALFCDPARKGSIRSAVLQALDAPADQALQTHVHEHFTWSHAAQATLAGYRSVLTPGSARSNGEI